MHSVRENGRDRWWIGERRKKKRMRNEAAAARRVTFNTALRNLSDLVYFRRYRCHARSVTVALNQQRYELSRGLRSRKAIYVTRENVNDSRPRSSSSIFSRSVDQSTILNAPTKLNALLQTVGSFLHIALLIFMLIITDSIFFFFI